MTDQTNENNATAASIDRLPENQTPTPTPVMPAGLAKMVDAMNSRPTRDGGDRVTFIVL